MDSTNLVQISLDNNIYRIKWQSAWLSQYIFICWFSKNFSSWRNCLTHTSSQVRDATVLYSALVLDRATTLCFLLFQEIMFPLMKTQYLVVECLSIRGPTQSTSEYQKVWVFPLSSYKKPCFGAFFEVS